MTDSAANFWDPLSRSEVDFVRAIMDQLRDTPWAKPLITSIEQAGGLVPANKAKFFELRFGYGLDQTGVTPKYEIPGEGSSTLDFGFVSGGRDFRVELMRLEETEAARGATHMGVDAGGVHWSSRVLSSHNDDRRQTEEGETLKAVQRICQKCEHGGMPHKFPLPDGAIHVLLVDTRTLFNGGDSHDHVHIALGGEYVTEPMARRYWQGTLISGAFSPRTTVRGAAQLRERVHFLGFVNEKNYVAGEIPLASDFIANPNLFRAKEDALEAFAAWPLRRCG
jgi:hypothetical protein